MRLLFTATAATDQRADGLTVFAESLAAHLAAEGHQCALFVADLFRHPPEAELSEERRGALQLYRAALPLPRTVAEALDRPGCDALFRRALEGWKAELVHFHALDGLSAGMIEVAGAMPLPTVMTVHDYYLLCPAARLMDLSLANCPGPEEGRRCANCLAATGNLTGRYRGALRWLLRRWDVKVAGLHGSALAGRFRRLQGLVGRLGAVACPSRFVAEMLARAGMGSGARVIPNGSELAPLASRAGGAPPVIGMLAHHSATKGAHLLVEALALAPDLAVRVEIHGGGDERYLAAVRAQARRDGRISFGGPFKPEDAPRIHAGLDALAAPSIWPENSPLVIQDALAAGRPVVVPDRGGAAESLGDGQYGLTFAIGNAASLAESLRKLAEPGTIERFRARLLADRPVPSRSGVARSYLALYSELTSLRGARGGT